MPQLQNNTERALVACSLWLHIGFIGAAALAVGLLQLFDGEPEWLSVLALVFSGGLLAAASWRRARTVLGHAERTSAVATGAPSESTSRASSKQAGRGTTATLSPIPRQSNRRLGDDRRCPAPE
jgi:membrane protein implicated in regulation of membrane protease activity